MSFTYYMKVDDKVFNLLALEYHMIQGYNDIGKPAGGVQGGRIRFLLEVQDDPFFASWMFNFTTTHDGMIVMYRIDEASRFKELKFTKAYLVNMCESFNVGAEPALMSEKAFPVEFEIYQWIHGFQERLNASFVLFCEISSETISLDGVSHDNKW
jgi:hypothetical protein